MRFHAVVIIEHSDTIKSGTPAAFHKILGKMVVEYCLKEIKSADPISIYAVVEKQEYASFLECQDVQVVVATKQDVFDKIKLHIKDDEVILAINGNIAYIGDSISQILYRASSQTRNSIFEITTAEQTINTRIDLANATKFLQNKINTKHMINGVTIQNPENTFISPDVEIGQDSIILTGTTIEGRTTIGECCTLGPNTQLTSMNIGYNVTIANSTCIESFVDDFTNVGPYSYLRPKSVIGKNCKIGDFVEVKNATIGDNSKASHLSYIGDAQIGSNVNIGCGSITVNYDGIKKYKTVIKDNAFIGCNTNLVAPITVAEGAFTAAGSTITKDVPKDNLAIARSSQENKDNWAIEHFGK